MPMDSIKRIREDSNLKLRIRVRSGPRIRANSGRIRIRANSCEFEPASLHPTYSGTILVREHFCNWLKPPLRTTTPTRTLYWVALMMETRALAAHL